MKICRNFKFATEFGNFFKLERKKAEIGKYLIIQKYEMVYVLKYVLSDREFIFVQVLLLNIFTAFAIIFLGKRNFISSLVICLSCKN